MSPSEGEGKQKKKKGRKWTQAIFLSKPEEEEERDTGVKKVR